MYPYLPLLTLAVKFGFMYLMTKTFIFFILRIIRGIQSPNSWAEDEEERPLARMFGEMEGTFCDLKHDWEWRHSQLLEKLNKLIPALPDTTTVHEDYLEEKIMKRSRKRKAEAEGDPQ